MFLGIQKPVCAVSGAKFLTESGWVDLRNPLDTDVPFRLFRDEGRTFLQVSIGRQFESMSRNEDVIVASFRFQWVGETELRKRMGGRLVLVHLLCREIGNEDQTTAADIEVFTPCVAFRVVGTPSKYLYSK